MKGYCDICHERLTRNHTHCTPPDEIWAQANIERRSASAERGGIYLPDDESEKAWRRKQVKPPPTIAELLAGGADERDREE